MIKLKSYYPSFHRSRKAGSENTCRLMSIWVLDPTQTGRLSNLKYFLCSKFCRGHTYAEKKLPFYLKFRLNWISSIYLVTLGSRPFFFFPVKREYLIGGSLWTLSDKRAQVWLFPLPFWLLRYQAFLKVPCLLAWDVCLTPVQQGARPGKKDMNNDSGLQGQTLHVDSMLYYYLNRWYRMV